MGHISKADGKVTKDEIRMASRVMQDMALSSQQRAAAKALFNEGKEDDFDIYAVLSQFRREIGRRTNLQRMFIEILCYAAYADGALHPAESRVLHLVCDEIGFSEYELESILASVTAELHHRRQGDGRITLDDAYAVLDIQENAGDAEVKKSLPPSDQPAPPGQTGVEGTARGNDENSHPEDPRDPPGLRMHQGTPGVLTRPWVKARTAILACCNRMITQKLIIM